MNLAVIFVDNGSKDKTMPGKYLHQLDSKALVYLLAKISAGFPLIRNKILENKYSLFYFNFTSSCLCNIVLYFELKSVHTVTGHPFG